MTTYQQYCPVARALEVLADRWTLLIVRELFLGSHRFNDIERGLPGISRSLLASRLRDLEEAGIIERLPGTRSNIAEYHFSDAGRELKPVIEALGGWGARWAFDDPKPEELDWRARNASVDQLTSHTSDEPELPSRNNDYTFSTADSPCQASCTGRRQTLPTTHAAQSGRRRSTHLRRSTLPHCQQQSEPRQHDDHQQKTDPCSESGRSSDLQHGGVARRQPALVTRAVQRQRVPPLRHRARQRDLRGPRRRQRRAQRIQREPQRVCRGCDHRDQRDVAAERAARVCAASQPEPPAGRSPQRRALGIETWVVAGGSWGSALALAYATTHPERVSGLILWSIFLLRPAEIDWFYQGGAGAIFPEAWERFLEPIPPDERDALVEAYHRRLTGPDPDERVRASRAWSVWEASTSKLLPDAALIDRFGEMEFAIAFARVECHYVRNFGFFDHPDQLLERVERLRDKPAIIVHSRYDVVSPMTTAWELHKRWPEAEFHVIPNAGHSMSEPPLIDSLVRASDRFRDLPVLAS